MIIKKYEQFILERLGVPDGIVDSATNLYELIVSKFEQTPNEELEDNRQKVLEIKKKYGHTQKVKL